MNFLNHFPLKKKRTFGSAFTLIEVIVVVAIIGILAVLVTISLGKAQAKSRDTKRVADLRQIRTAVEMHKEVKNVLPGMITGYYYQSNHTPWWSSKVIDGTTQFETDLRSFLDPLPRDPKNGSLHLSEEWWTELTYRYRNSGATYELDSGMEMRTDLVENDGGGRQQTTYNFKNELDGRYEVGTDLTLLN